MAGGCGRRPGATDGVAARGASTALAGSRDLRPTTGAFLPAVSTASTASFFFLQPLGTTVATAASSASASHRPLSVRLRRSPKTPKLNPCKLMSRLSLT